MNKLELVTARHRALKAVVYIRQSTPQQVISNQESLKLQRALKKRASDLGWPSGNIEIVEDDLGLTGTSTEHREGFKNMVAKVSLGQVGIIICFDVSRLIRNCSDLYPVLDLCGYQQCLIADRDGVYDPCSTNGRLLLGLKGQLAEVELSTIRARLWSGRLNKAKRGELNQILPAGFIRNELDQVQKDPNMEVQQRIKLVFDLFLRFKSAAKVVRYLNEEGLLAPRRTYLGDICWRKPSTATVLCFLKNPAYAGTYVFGRYKTVQNGPSPVSKRRKALPMDQWEIVVHNKYPAYIEWELFKKIQMMLRDNYANYDKNKTRGVPRNGKALLQGIAYCGECGHKLIVTYKNVSRYMCNHMRRHYLEKICQYIPTEPIDHYVVNAFFEAISPIELDAYHQVLKAGRRDQEQLNGALKQQLERLRYEARLAERQYNQVDPDNRLIAAELERRWELALRELQKAESEYEQKTKVVELPKINRELREAISNLGKNLPEVWHKSQLSHEQRKSFLRCLIDKVVMHRLDRESAQARIVWKGGATTTLTVPLPVNSIAELTRAEEMKKRVVELANNSMSDSKIAAVLTKEGFRSPTAEHVLRSTVATIRRDCGIFQRKDKIKTANN